MKILTLSTVDEQGGAARAAYRLHRALLTNHIDSQMLVQSKISDDFTVLGPQTKFQKFLGVLRPSLDALPVGYYKKRSAGLFSPSWLPFSGIVEKINSLQPDIVHLHWIAGGMLRIEDIAKIKAPIVWTMHDMWPFTGGCHYDEDCAGYKSNCVGCKVLNTVSSRSLSHKVYNRKKKTFDKKRNITVVGLSRWLMSAAQSSSLFFQFDHVNIPNPIDSITFSPIDKQIARQLLNIPLDKKLVLFGAMAATRDPRKGFNQLSQALKLLATKDCELLVFGANQPQNQPDFKQKTHYLGQLHDDLSLRVIYSAADVMVVPSLQENLSNAILESLACGLPVVGFNVGGNQDLIDHKNNGYLAEPFDIDDLAKGVDWVLSTSNYPYLCYNARQKILKEFDSNVVVNQYIKLYQKILA